MLKNIKNKRKYILNIIGYGSCLGSIIPFLGTLFVMMMGKNLLWTDPNGIILIIEFIFHTYALFFIIIKIINLIIQKE